MTKIRLALLATAFAAVTSTGAVAEDTAEKAAQMRVDYDQSLVMRLDRAAKTVLIGNAQVADAQLVNERTIYVLGRMFGNTNIIALDADGNEISNTSITVGAPDTMQVTLYRGPRGQRNLACAPKCERTVTQGDAEMEQIFQDNDHKVDISAKSAALASGGK